ncbi:MAG: TssN family type VI secretion system protein [Saprospiraceae bacterium]
MTMDNIIFFILMAVVTIVSLIIFWINNGKPDKRTMLHALIYLLIGALLGLLGWVLRQFADLSLTWNYYLMTFLAFCTGLLQIYLLYQLMWSTRDSLFWERDSLQKEAAFTFFTAQLFTLGFMLVYFFLSHLGESEATTFWSLFVPFSLPFVITKVLDLMNQVPGKEFEKKWVYQLTELDETRWDWVNTMIIGFNVVDSFKNEDRWRPKIARFTIRAPRNQPLSQVYRLALRVYHDQNPVVPVQDIGYEKTPPEFWWLFYIKFNLFKPSTWFVKQRYLDPDLSLENNRLQNDFMATAKRIPF